ncbi:MAG: serpin family protein [Vulcanimicrobiota bacterium]
MNKSLMIFLISLFVCLAFPGLSCKAEKTIPQPGNDKKETPQVTRGPHVEYQKATMEDIRKLSSNNNAFALDLYRQLIKNDKGNIFFSPYSISTALAMTYLGAEGETAEEIKKTLHFNMEPSLLHSSFLGLLNHMENAQQGEAFKLVSANRLWIEQGYKFSKAFIDDCLLYYKAEPEDMNFNANPDESRERINKWVEKKTNDKIKQLLAEKTVTTDTRMVLTNAIYFKSRWMNEFSPNLTRRKDFYLNKNEKVEVQMMRKQAEFAYAETDDYQLVVLPYLEGKLSMIILLPREIDGMQKVEAKLDLAGLNDVMKNSRYPEVDLSLPKFETESSFELKEVLEKMGMESAFQFGPADFSGMTGNRELFISAVVHKAFVDVNEEGTEATAATAVEMIAGSAPPREPPEVIEFKADHAFIFIIRDNQTENFLFMGRIMNPLK